jgi:hypothetical protein
LEVVEFVDGTLEVEELVCDEQAVMKLMAKNNTNNFIFMICPFHLKKERRA